VLEAGDTGTGTEDIQMASWEEEEAEQKNWDRHKMAARTESECTRKTSDTVWNRTVLKRSTILHRNDNSSSGRRGQRRSCIFTRCGKNEETMTINFRLNKPGTC
jgi:hypothetical protein